MIVNIHWDVDQHTFTDTHSCIQTHMEAQKYSKSTIRWRSLRISYYISIIFTTLTSALPQRMYFNVYLSLMMNIRQMSSTPSSYLLAWAKNSQSLLFEILIGSDVSCLTLGYAIALELEEKGDFQRWPIMQDSFQHSKKPNGHLVQKKMYIYLNNTIIDSFKLSHEREIQFNLHGNVIQ